MNSNECPICMESMCITFNCDQCHQSFCLNCFSLLKNEVCPFCRKEFCTREDEEEHHIYSQSYPIQSSTITDINSFSSYSNDWNQSRILRRKLRREQKNRDAELQKIRNAELSRIHNYTKKKKIKKHEMLQFAMD